MDFLYADLNEIVDPFAYTVEKTDNTIKMDIDNNKRTLSAKVQYTPGQLTINNGRDEVVSFNGSANRTILIPEYKIVRVPSDNGDIRAQYSLMKWDFSKEQYVQVDGDTIYLEELLDELNIENGSTSNIDSKKVGSGNSSISSVKYVHNGVDVDVPLMKSPATNLELKEELSIKAVGLKSGGIIHGGTLTGVLSLALGGQPYGLSQQCTLCVTYEQKNVWYDIISEYPLVLRHITNGSDIYDITENIGDNGYNSTIDLPIGQGITFNISRQNNLLVSLMPQNILQKNIVQTKIIRGDEQCPTAKGNQSVSIGGGTLADYNWSQAFGLGTITSRPGQMVVGMYNELEPDALLIVGNGYYDALTGDIHRSNAAAIMRDGSIKTYNSSAAIQSAIAEKASKEELKEVVGYIPTKTSDLDNDSGYLTTETDPTVPAWAKQASKPSYRYSEIQDTPTIPTKVSELTNDSGYVKDLSNYYNKTQINDLVDSSHVVNITDLNERYTPDTLPNGTASDNGKRVLVKESGVLYYYSYDSSLKTWRKGYKIKGSTLYLNLADSCMYRYTNNDKTTPYPNFIKMTISPATIEDEFGKVSSSIDDVASSIDTKIADLVGSAPDTLDTLEELAAALKTNADIVDTLNEAIGKKANASEVEAEFAKKANASEVEALNKAIVDKVDKTALSAVATSGSYNDLTNAPGAETWTFTLDDGITKVTKKVYVG